MSASTPTDCILITNPAHDYAREFIDRAKKICGQPVVGVFSLKWRYEEFLQSFQDLAREMHSWVVACEGSDDEKVLAVRRHLEAQHLQARAIVPWDDSGVLLGGKLSDAFDLPWLSYEQAFLFKNKYALKKYLSENTSLRINRFALANSAEEVLAFQRELGKWPIVIKPVAAGGSWNVFIVRSEAEVREYAPKILGAYNEYEQTVNEQILVEEYIGGKEYTVDGQTDREGRVMVYGVYEEYKILGNGLRSIYYDSYYHNPANEQWQTIVKYSSQIVGSCSLNNSAFHLELKLDHGGACLVEVTCRPVGGSILFLSSKVCMVDLFDLAAQGFLGRLSFGKPINVLGGSENKIAMAIQGITLEDGYVTKVDGVDMVRKKECFFRADNIPAVGQLIRKTVDFDTAQYVVCIIGTEMESLKKEAHHIRSMLKVYNGYRINSMTDHNGIEAYEA